MTVGTTAAAISLMTIVGLGLAAPASAADADAKTRSPADVIAQLEEQGHHVQLNGSSNVPLSQCKLTGVHGLNDSNLDTSGNRIDSDLYTTVYVDVVCNDV